MKLADLNAIAPRIPPGREDGRWKMEDGKWKREEARGKSEEGRESRKCQEAPRRHQGGTEEAPCIYIESRASISKTGTRTVKGR